MPIHQANWSDNSEKKLGLSWAWSFFFRGGDGAVHDRTKTTMSAPATHNKVMCSASCGGADGSGFFLGELLLQVLNRPVLVVGLLIVLLARWLHSGGGCRLSELPLQLCDPAVLLGALSLLLLGLWRRNACSEDTDLMRKRGKHLLNAFLVLLALPLLFLGLAACVCLLALAFGLAFLGLWIFLVLQRFRGADAAIIKHWA